MFTGEQSARIREILISEPAWEEMTCLFALSIINLDLFSLREEKLKLWQPDVLSYISRHHVQFVLLSLPLLELLLMYSTVQLAFSRQVP